MGHPHKNNKKKKPFHNNSSNNQNASATKVQNQNLTQLTDEAVEINKLLQEKYQKMRQQKHFIYILSVKWLNQWKQYVGYDFLFKDSYQGKKRAGKNIPKGLNQNLVEKCPTLLEVPEQLQQYKYLNVLVNNKFQENKDYIGIHKQLWQKFNQIYGPGIQIKRPFRFKKSMEIDCLLKKCDVIFINYNQPNFQQKMQSWKSNKNVSQYFHDCKVQFSAIWKLEDLYIYLQKLCQIKYSCNKIYIWLCQNFLTTSKIKQNFGKAVKNKTYQLNAFKLSKNDYKNIDLTDFIKRSYTILIEIGASRIKTQENPDSPSGYCECCITVKPSLRYHCQCGHRYYCKRECQVDDQLYHFMSCPLTFNTSDDQQYKEKIVKDVSVISKCGLKNLGNTCYMNSSIQMLLCLDFLVNFFTLNEYRNSISKKEQYAEMYLERISKTFKMMGEQTEFIQPWDLKGQINYFLGPFRGYKQHDALDFLTNFLNSINDCLSSPISDEAYHPIINNNLMGQYNSLVICPDCKIQFKNTQIFIQLSLPIKHKVQKNIYTYACYDSLYSCRYGKAQVRNKWAAIRQDIGVSGDCLMYSGCMEGSQSERNQSLLVPVTEDEPSESVLKKMKKQLLFFPYVTVQKGQIVLPASFIRTHVVSGVNLRANISVVFPVMAKLGKTMGHFTIDLIRYINSCKNEDLLKDLQTKYDQIANKANYVQKQQKQLDREQSQTTINSSLKQNNHDSQTKDLNPKIPSKNEQIDQSYLQLDNLLENLLQELKIQIFIIDTKKKKNICHFCSKKCQGCKLPSSFKSKIDDILLPKTKQLKILLHSINKPQLTKTLSNKTSSNDTTINDCLQLFGEPETLDQENAWYCQKCQGMKLALKQLEVRKFPRYLIIQINRFKNGANGKIKNSQPIAYEEYEMIGNHRYKLLSVILHEGSIEGGHYEAICRRGDSFYLFNDTRVSKTTKMINKNAYIFCYQKQQHQLSTTNDKIH